MSTGGGKIHKNALAQQAQAQERQNKIFERLLQPSAEQVRWNEKSDAWDDWIGAKNYSSAPKGDILDFDLWNPSHVQQQRERMSDLEGIGAAGMGGDNSIALQLSRERNNNAAAEDAGASYEAAVKGRNSFFEGNALPYAQLELGKLSGLLNNSSQNTQFWGQQAQATAPQSLLPAIFGGALSLGSSLLGLPNMFGGGAGAGGRRG